MDSFSSNASCVGPGFVLRTLAADETAVLPSGCAVFVRSGCARFASGGRDVLVDVNHAILFPYESDRAILRASEAPATLAFVRDPWAHFGYAPSVRTVDSALFLLHYRRSPSVIDALHDAPRKPAVSPARYGAAMQAYANAHLDRPFSLIETARACALSPFTTSRVFHRELGIPLRDYARRLRMRAALAQIAQGRDLADIARELGYVDHSHFTRTFRSEFGVVPSQWRAHRQHTAALCG